MSSLQRAAIVFLVTALAIFGIYRFGFNKGWGERDAEMQAAIAKANEESRQTEQRLAAEINTNATKLQEANNAIGEKQSALDRAIRSGRVRLPAASCLPAPEGAAAPVGNSEEAPSESDRETLAAIAAIVADGDRAINQLNSCIDAYNQVRDQLNGQH